jgi:hypothetical protein
MLYNAVILLSNLFFSAPPSPFLVHSQVTALTVARSRDASKTPVIVLCPCILAEKCQTTIVQRRASIKISVSMGSSMLENVTVEMATMNGMGHPTVAAAAPTTKVAGSSVCMSSLRLVDEPLVK